MSEKKTWNRAVKDNHFDLLVTFQRCDDFVELRNCVRAKNVEGRVINRYAPIRGRSSRQKNLFVAHIYIYIYSALCLAQRLERRAKLGHEDFRTCGFTGREAGQVELFSRRRATSLALTQTLKNVVLGKVTILLRKATGSELVAHGSLPPRRLITINR